MTEEYYSKKVNFFHPSCLSVVTPVTAGSTQTAVSTLINGEVYRQTCTLSKHLGMLKALLQQSLISVFSSVICRPFRCLSGGNCDFVYFEYFSNHNHVN